MPAQRSHEIPKDLRVLPIAPGAPLLLGRAKQSPFGGTSMHAPHQLHFTILGVLIASAALVGACDEKLSDIAGPSPNLEPTFSSIQREIFETTDTSGRAACIQCHTNAGGRTPSGGMNLSHDVAYATLVGVGSRGKTGVVRVIPGDPDHSYIIQKLEGAPGIVGERMPRTGGPYLTEGQIAIIKRWIETGANND
jgi:hypothetical protein